MNKWKITAGDGNSEKKQMEMLGIKGRSEVKSSSEELNDRLATAERSISEFQVGSVDMVRSKRNGTEEACEVGQSPRATGCRVKRASLCVWDPTWERGRGGSRRNGLRGSGWCFSQD